MHARVGKLLAYNMKEGRKNIDLEREKRYIV